MQSNVGEKGLATIVVMRYFEMIKEFGKGPAIRRFDKEKEARHGLSTFFHQVGIIDSFCCRRDGSLEGSVWCQSEEVDRYLRRSSMSKTTVFLTLAPDDLFCCRHVVLLKQTWLMGS